MTLHEELISRAIQIAKRAIKSGASPFGAVVATSAGKIIHEAHNTVRSGCDPTAHAEVNAIRGACRTLGTIDLQGHVIATTCEPCPMCAAAIHWAKLDAVIFGASIADAKRAGFSELSVACEALYAQGGANVKIHTGILEEECRALFDKWHNGPFPQTY